MADWDLIIGVSVFIVWLVLMLFVFPKIGVPT
jgi:hypothetical protein